MLAKIDNCTTATEVTKSLNVIAQAWSEVTADVSFRKAGILNESFEVVTRAVAHDDIFSDLDTEEEMSLGDEESQDMIQQLSGNPCTVQELVTFDDDLPVCADYNGDEWEEMFLE